MSVAENWPHLVELKDMLEGLNGRTVTVTQHGAVSDEETWARMAAVANRAGTATLGPKALST